MAEFNLKGLIVKAHYGDYIALPFPKFGYDKIKKKKADAKKVGNDSVFKDVLGRPYFMEVRCGIDGVNYYLPNEPLISLSLQNNIVKTVVLGNERKGTVKEWIANDDYSISIKGVCVEKSQEGYPSSQVETLRKISEHRGSIEVQNDLLRLFGIYSMCVESINYADMEGYPGVQIYEMNCISDMDFYADLDEKKDLNKL